jgi:hypothetical protein
MQHSEFEQWRWLVVHCSPLGSLSLHCVYNDQVNKESCGEARVIAVEKHLLGR